METRFLIFALEWIYHFAIDRCWRLHLRIDKGSKIHQFIVTGCIQMWRFDFGKTCFGTWRFLGMDFGKLLVFQLKVILEVFQLRFLIFVLLLYTGETVSQLRDLQSIFLFIDLLRSNLVLECQVFLFGRCFVPLGNYEGCSQQIQLVIHVFGLQDRCYLLRYVARFVFKNFQCEMRISQNIVKMEFSKTRERNLKIWLTLPGFYNIGHEGWVISLGYGKKCVPETTMGNFVVKYNVHSQIVKRRIERQIAIEINQRDFIRQSFKLMAWPNKQTFDRLNEEMHGN